MPQIWAVPRPCLTIAGLGSSLGRWEEAEPDHPWEGFLLTCAQGVGGHFLLVRGGSVPKCVCHRIKTGVCNLENILRDFLTKS